jgi:hypothetical protein
MLESTIGEYRALRSLDKEADQLVAELTRSHDWTEEGARAIVSLAVGYGSFMLRNALAMAIALEKEDGDLGF